MDGLDLGVIRDGQRQLMEYLASLTPAERLEVRRTMLANIATCRGVLYALEVMEGRRPEMAAPEPSAPPMAPPQRHYRKGPRLPRL
jgi:hypothetical protein